jgi:hypothetical protein
MWARAGTAWPGASIEPTTGAAGAAVGGTPTTRSATACTAAGHTRVGERGRPAGCASSRPACSKNPAGPSTWASSEPVWPAAVPRQHALPTAPHPPPQARTANGRRRRRTGFALSRGARILCSSWTPTRPWCANGAARRQRPDPLLHRRRARPRRVNTGGPSDRPTTSSDPCGCCRSSRTRQARRSTPATCCSCPAMTATSAPPWMSSPPPACSSTTGSPMSSDTSPARPPACPSR